MRYDIIAASPSDLHQAISMDLCRQIAIHLKGNQCIGRAAPYDVRLPDYVGQPNNEISTVVQPDIIVVCDPGKLDDRGVVGAPDLVIEISSPVTAEHDLVTKFNLYERVGVKEYWIVQPIDKTVMVFKLRHRTMTFDLFARYGSRGKVPVPLLGDLVIDLAEVFAD